MRRVRRLVKRSPALSRTLLPVQERVHQRLRLVQWRLRRGDAPYPPALVKHRTVLDYARRHSLRVLVETGTYLGGTVAALRRRFDRVYSIELSEELHRRARDRFARTRNVELLHGDSATLLRDLLERVREPCLFWLDSHVSTTDTAQGEEPSPVLHELDAILTHPIREHVVLVDDARLLTGRDGWPALAAVEEHVRRLAPERTIEVENDIVRITPPPRS